MTDNLQCPNCEIELSESDNMKYRVRGSGEFWKSALIYISFPWKKNFEEIFRANLVVCPNCKYEFSTKGYKYFGYLTAHQLQIGLLIFFLLLVLAPGVAVFWRIVK